MLSSVRFSVFLSIAPIRIGEVSFNLKTSMNVSFYWMLGSWSHGQNLSMYYWDLADSILM